MRGPRRGRGRECRARDLERHWNYCPALTDDWSLIIYADIYWTVVLFPLDLDLVARYLVYGLVHVIKYGGIYVGMSNLLFRRRLRVFLFDLLLFLYLN